MYKVGRSRTPQGVRGLKLRMKASMGKYGLSHSARSAWIETDFNIPRRVGSQVALRKECVD